MKKSVVFLSSTIHDLQNERRTIYELLEDMGYIPIASEYPNFDVGDGRKHSYDICLDNVDKSDVVIALIGHRLGGVTTYKRQKTSITFAEIRHALGCGKVVYIFCRQSVSDERLAFKKALSHFSSKEDAFANLKSGLRTDSYKVFDNLDDITGLDRNNWITFFTDEGDLLKKLRFKLAGYNLDRLASISVNYTGVIDMIKRGTDIDMSLYDPDYDVNREKSKKLLGIIKPFFNADIESQQRLANAKTMDRIRHLYSANTNYANQTGMHSAELCLNQDGKVFYGFDTQMEQNSLGVWTKDRSFRNYLQFTKSCAQKEDGKHYRVFLFESKNFISKNSRSIYDNVVTQLSFGVISIITTYQQIPSNIPYGLMNCNALLGERVLVVILPVGFTMLYTKRSDRGKVELYDESFKYIRSAAARGIGALMFCSLVSYQHFVKMVHDVDFDTMSDIAL